MSMKKILIFALLLICFVPLFAAEPEIFYKQLSAMFLIDLNSEVYYSHNSSTTAPRWAGQTTTSTDDYSNYYDTQIIGVLGINNATEAVTFKVTLTSGSWLYLLDAGDKTISRPFGLDLILKSKQTAKGSEYYYDYNGQGPVIHMGLQDATGRGGTVLSAADNKSFEVTISASDLASYGSIVWVDVCLVLPALDSNGSVTIDGTTYTAKSDDRIYSSKITVEVSSGSLNKSVVLDMTGTYKSNSSSTTDTGLKSIMNVIPKAAATSLNIQALGSNTAKPLVNVASYSYMTESKYIENVTYEDEKAYIFLSSTASESTAGDTFKLRRLRDDGSYSPTDSAFNSVTFVAYLSEDETGSTNAVSFDGTAKYSSSSTTSYFAVDPIQVSSQNGEEYVRWQSDGYIFVQITPTSDEDVTQLTAGKYTETIYIHVVSPE